MTTRLFSEALNELNDKYIVEAAQKPQTGPLPLVWWSAHKIAACICAAVFAAAFSFGTAFAVNADFRQAVISFLFPIYTERTLHEIDEGHRTASFDRADTLCTFLEKFNAEHMIEGLTVTKDSGFHYVFLEENDLTLRAIVDCDTPNDKLLVTMERIPYKETTGLWQVSAYQVIDSKTAAEMLERQQSSLSK